MIPCPLMDTISPLIPSLTWRLLRHAFYFCFCSIVNAEYCSFILLVSCSEFFDSLSVSDSVFQLDIFEHIGVPLVEHCLAGFNSSVFAYGQVFFFSSL